jgi:hypothetical protein
MEEKIQKDIRTSGHVYLGTHIIGVLITSIIGGLVGWTLDSWFGAFIGVALGAGCGWVVSDSILWLNDGQIGRIMRGAFIGIVILGSAGIAGAARMQEGAITMIFVLLWVGVIWGAVVFADLKVALKWAVRGAALGPVASLVVGISISITGTGNTTKLLTIPGVIALVGIMTFACAIAALSGLLFVQNLLSYALSSYLGFRKTNQS